jgi:hypothetical protein
LKENFLAVFDGTDECKSAVRYAARRAKINNAGLLIVATVEKESRDALEELSINIKLYSDISCDYIIEHGSKLEAVKNLISLDNSISLLILASNKKDKNPGILVETISGDGYSIPVVVIPGNLSDNDIDKLAGFDNV